MLSRTGPRRRLRSRPADHRAKRARGAGPRRGHLADRRGPGTPGWRARPALLGLRSLARARAVGHRAARGRQHRYRRPACPAPAPLRRTAGTRRPDPDRGGARRHRRAGHRMAGAPRRPARADLPMGPPGYGCGAARRRDRELARRGPVAERGPCVRLRGRANGRLSADSAAGDGRAASATPAGLML